MKDLHFNYVQDLTRYQRQKTWEVKIGDTPLGGNNPIRIQSMTDTDSRETEATVDQIIKIVKEKCFLEG